MPPRHLATLIPARGWVITLFSNAADSNVSSIPRVRILIVRGGSRGGPREAVNLYDYDCLTRPRGPDTLSVFVGFRARRRSRGGSKCSMLKCGGRPDFIYYLLGMASSPMTFLGPFELLY